MNSGCVFFERQLKFKENKDIHEETKAKQSKSEVFDYRGLWCLKSECKHVGDPAKINTKGKVNY